MDNSLNYSFNLANTSLMKYLFIEVWFGIDFLIILISYT